MVLITWGNYNYGVIYDEVKNRKLSTAGKKHYNCSEGATAARATTSIKILLTLCTVPHAVSWYSVAVSAVVSELSDGLLYSYGYCVYYR